MKIPWYSRKPAIEGIDLSEARAQMSSVIDEAVDTGVRVPLTEKAAMALGPMLFEVGDGEDINFQRITSPQMRRDLNPLMQQRMQAVAFYLAATNPFAKRIREVITSYVVGRGFTVACKDERVQEVVDKFWNDPVNRMWRTVRQYCDELTTYGELCIPVAVNEVDGSVRLGYIDPLDLENIEFAQMATAGEDAGLSFAVAVILRKRADQQQNSRVQVIRKDEDPESPTFGLLQGQCFYWAINKARGASRGLSEFFNLTDWLDVFDQMIFDFADRARMLNAYVWDLALEGADQATVDKTRDEMTKRPPRQGGVFVHNSSVTLDAKTPELHGADMKETGRVVKGYGLGGVGLPPSFFGDSENSNRSTAEEMSGPAGKKFEDRQVDLSGNMGDVIDFVIDQAIVHGVLPPDVDRSYDIQTPEILVRDLQKAATTMSAVTNSLSVAEENGWIRSETAARAFHQCLEGVGVSVDSKEEFEGAQEELHLRQANDINTLTPQKNLADALDQLDQAQPGAKKKTEVVN